MDVPFVSSGASSRLHYTLVRKVENAVNQREAEAALVAQMEAIRKQLFAPAVSTSTCKELLTILLYCATASVDGTITITSLQFALPSAVNLAEAGKKISERRTGYMFCLEVMPPDHELQLMLVNTIYKDLASNSVSRIALALETVISAPSVDIIPAIQIRLQDLMSHSSPIVRSLAIHAIRMLSQLDPGLRRSKHVRASLLCRFEDGNEYVQRAAFRLAKELVQDGLLKGTLLYEKCIGVFRTYTSMKRQMLSTSFPAALFQTVLQVVSSLIDSQPLMIVQDRSSLIAGVILVLHSANLAKSLGVILDCFRVLSQIPHQDIARQLTSSKPTSNLPEANPDSLLTNKHAQTHPVETIRPLLSSRNPNDRYLFMSCLELLHVSLWAGTPSPATPSAEIILTKSTMDLATRAATSNELTLEQWEVERIMGFLDSSDRLIRKLTLHILIRVDRIIVEQYYVRLLQQHSDETSTGRLKGNDQTISRLLDVTAELAKSDQDGEAYGAKLIEILRIAQTASTSTKSKSPLVLPDVLEAVLTQSRSDTFQRGLVTKLLSSFQGEESVVPPEMLDNVDAQQAPKKTSEHGGTHILIFAALACEYAHILPSSEVPCILQALSSLLESCHIALAESILLSMTRIVLFTRAGLGLHDDVLQLIERFKDNNGAKHDALRRSIMKRCDQFCRYFRQTDKANVAISIPQPQSLPDFALALDQSEETQNRVTDRSPSRAKPVSPTSEAQARSPSRPDSKLRYEAYEPPQPTPRLRRGYQPSQSERPSGSRPVIGRKAFPGEARQSTTDRRADGDLIEMDAVSLKSPPRTRTDLISLDSPFLALADENNPPILLQHNGSSTLPVPVLPPTSLEKYMSSSTRESSSERTPSFEDMWNAVVDNGASARGWCDAPMEDLVWRLQSLNMQMNVVPADVAPFTGELKVILHFDPSPSVSQSVSTSEPPGQVTNSGPWSDPSHASATDIQHYAAIRLREGDEGSCLWQLRCPDEEQKTTIIHIFQNDPI